MIDACNAPTVTGGTGSIEEIGTQRARYTKAVQDFFAATLHANQHASVGSAIVIARATAGAAHSIRVTQAQSPVWTSAVAAGCITKQCGIVAHQFSFLDTAGDGRARSISVCRAAAASDSQQRNEDQHPGACGERRTIHATMISQVRGSQPGFSGIWQNLVGGSYTARRGNLCAIRLLVGESFSGHVVVQR